MSAAGVLLAAIRVLAAPGLEDDAARLAREAASAEQDVAADLGVAPDAEVWLARSARELGRYLPAPPPEWADGIAFPALRRIGLARHDSQGRRVDLATVLRHEYSHVALHQAVGGRPLPRWFVEGFAHVQARQFSLGRIQTLAFGLATGRLVPLADLDRAFPERDDAAATAYAQSYDFVGWLLREHGRGALRALVAAVAGGASFSDAVRAATGRGLGTLEADWLRDLRRRYFWVPVVSGGTALWVVAAVLLVAGWLRRRRLAAARLAAMPDDE